MDWFDILMLFICLLFPEKVIIINTIEKHYPK
jgi:hypothetical protein